MTSESSSAVQRAIGWHGKLPTLGDFAGRRLDSDFVNVWDSWLSAGLARLRASDERHWLDAYLASPTWRFLLTPGFLPSPLNIGYWAGVVMPSVDRVGRYYPLTLASPLAAIPVQADRQAALWSWMQLLEDAAVNALQDDWTIEMLEAELRHLGLPPDPPSSENDADIRPVNELSALKLASPDFMDTFFAPCTSMTFSPLEPGRCFWYSKVDTAAPRMFYSQRLDDSISNLWVNQGKRAVN